MHPPRARAASVLRATRALIGALALIIASPALAQHRSIFAAAEQLPHDVDFVFAMDDAAALRQGPHGRRLEQMLSTLLVLQPLSAELSRRWIALARALDFPDPDAMFDEVFGQRVIVATRITPQGQQATVLVTDITRAVEDRIRRTLEPVPRKAHAGHNVLRPRGDQQFSMVLTRTDSGARLYMTLATHEELLEDVLELAAGRPARTLADEPVLDELMALNPRPVACLYVGGRMLPRTHERLAATFAPVADPGVFELRFSGRLRHAPDPDHAGTTWPAGLFDQWKDRAHILMLGAAPVDGFIRPIISELAPGARLPAIPQELAAGMAPRRAFIVAPASLGPGLELAWVAEVKDVDAVAPAADAALERDLFPDTVTPQFAGIFPGALRVAETAPPDDDGRRRTIAWNFHAEDGGSGWWAWGCGGRSLVSEFGAAIAHARQSTVGMPQLSVGHIAFDKLRRYLPPGGDGLLARAASSIDALSWQTYQVDQRIIGSATAHLAPVDPRRRSE